MATNSMGLLVVVAVAAVVAAAVAVAVVVEVGVVVVVVVVVTVGPRCRWLVEVLLLRPTTGAVATPCNPLKHRE